MVKNEFPTHILHWPFSIWRWTIFSTFQGISLCRLPIFIASQAPASSSLSATEARIQESSHLIVLAVLTRLREKRIESRLPGRREADSRGIRGKPGVKRRKESLQE
ncbi:hypothetical protein M8J76_017307 [Diaphorina citri]|nr:hypothetical protein M8J75_014037 [Diaphorina citri]KAI5746102.1 hypothetical protein M8J76_017307 [Diaphorina citri]